FKNTGNVTLTGVSISDVHGGSGALSPMSPASVATLAPGASTTFTASYVVTQADVDAGTAITNTASGNATPSAGTFTPPTDSASVDVEAVSPGMKFSKIASPNTGAAVGDVVTYTYQVFNVGNVTQSNVTVTDVHSGSGSLSAISPASVASLAPGTDATFTATYTITQADFDAG
ncbi:MAG: DUF7507 domain-containing protein, partial [Maricaulaceae bacterium]